MKCHHGSHLEKTFQEKEAAAAEEQNADCLKPRGRKKDCHHGQDYISPLFASRQRLADVTEMLLISRRALRQYGRIVSFQTPNLLLVSLN